MITQPETSACGNRISEVAKSFDGDLRFHLNGRPVHLHDISPTTLLVDYLRSAAVGLTGTKVGCKQGGCGACTVLLSRYDADAQMVVHRSINSCLRPLASLDGMAITTVEGVGSVEDKVSPVQYCLAKNNGTQCGFCTPGWVMSAHGFLAARGIEKLKLNTDTDRVEETGAPLTLLPTNREVQERFDGNLCRCTGYRPILFGLGKGFARDWTAADDGDAKPCMIDPAESVEVSDRITPPFPDELKLPPRSVRYMRDGYHWYRPISLRQLHGLLRDFPGEHQHQLVGGNTSIGIYDRYVEDPLVRIDINHIRELKRVEIHSDRMTVGAAVTYNDFLDVLSAQIVLAREAHPERIVGLEALHYLAQRTGGAILRDAATLGGNTMLVLRHISEGTPFPSDLFTALSSIGARVGVWNPRTDQVEIYGILDLAARYTADPALRATFLIVRYEIPFSKAGDFFETYKVALREVNAHSITNAGFFVSLDHNNRATDARFIIGGVAPVAVHLAATEKEILGKPWDWSLFESGEHALVATIRALTESHRERIRDLPWEGFTEADRIGQIQGYWRKFFLKVALRINPGIVNDSEQSATFRAPRPLSRGTQRYMQYFAKDDIDRNHSLTGPLNEPYVKIEAFMQATGEAIFPQDFALPARGMEAAYVFSTCAKGKFEYRLPGKDSPARPGEVLTHVCTRFPGIIDYVTSLDLTAEKNLQGFGKDQPLFAECDRTVSGPFVVETDGQAIGLIVGDDQQVVRDAAHFVSTQLIRYFPETPVISFEEGLAANSFFEDALPESKMTHIWKLVRPGTQESWAGVPRDAAKVADADAEVVTGRQVVGSQIHFYMETQTCVIIPGEAGQMMVISSAQNSNSVQQSVASLLGLAMNQVVVRIKRIGGGYGGKCYSPNLVAMAAAFVARKHNRAVRLAVKRETDTAMFGHRHPARGEFAVAIRTGAGDPQQLGKIVGLRNDVLLNGGWTYDFSFIVADCLQLRADTSYHVQNYATSCDVLRTNAASRTSFRAMGLMQALILQEEAIEKAAHKIGMLPEDVRRKNLYGQGDKTPFGQVLNECYLKTVFDYTRKKYSFNERLAAIETFNASNRYKKRGISLIPVKYGSGWNLPLLEQAGALVNVFSADGTVIVRTGGVEMGQGLNTKIAQAASYFLGVPLSLVRVAELDTSVVPQATTTGASTGSTFNAEAVAACCRDLRRRLIDFCRENAPLKLPALRLRKDVLHEKPGITWSDETYESQPERKYEAWTEEEWRTIIRKAYAARFNLSSQQRVKIRGGTTLADKRSLVYKPSVTPPEFPPGFFTDYTFSAAISEVEIDVLTGETVILQSDIVYDCGKSQNPAVDIGQIEGAFMQGVGYVMYEEVVHQPDGPRKGVLVTNNTWTYKPPAVTSVPRLLNVDLYPCPDKDTNPLSSSKEVGEPPMALAGTVFFAIKHAIIAARRDQGDAGWIEFEAPATVTRVRQACVVPAAPAGA